MSGDIKEPLDLSHHVSRVTKQRKESSIKEFYKYFAIPGIGNLAGGMSHAATAQTTPALRSTLPVRRNLHLHLHSCLANHTCRTSKLLVLPI